MQKRDHFGSSVGSRGFSKKPMAKIWDFALRKKETVERRMTKRVQKRIFRMFLGVFNFKNFPKSAKFEKFKPVER